MNADPCGSGSTALVFNFIIIIIQGQAKMYLYLNFLRTVQYSR